VAARGDTPALGDVAKHGGSKLRPSAVDAAGKEWVATYNHGCTCLTRSGVCTCEFFGPDGPTRPLPTCTPPRMLRARAPVTGLALVAHSGTPRSPCAGCCGQCVRPSGRRPGRPPRPDAPQASRITCRPAALPPCRPARRPASLVTTPPAPATGAGYTPMAINGSSTAVCAACGPGTYKSTPGRCCRAALPRSRACGASVCARAGASPCRCMCATPRGVALIPRPVCRTRGRAMRGAPGGSRAGPVRGLSARLVLRAQLCPAAQSWVRLCQGSGTRNARGDQLYRLLL